MSKKAKILILILNSLFSALIVIGTALFMQNWGWLVKTVLYAFGGGGLILGFLLFFLKKEALLKTVFIAECMMLVFFVAIVLVNKFGELDKYKTDEEKINRIVDMIKSSGKWGMLIFVIIQILQAVILPLPALVCYLPGARIWSPWIATLLASIGVIIGSIISYVIGRLFGKRVVVWVAGEKNTKKYTEILGKRGKIIFVMMQILPFFPDDLLCMIAGLTSMNFAFFVTVMVLVRPLIIAMYCFFGSGTIIPFSGWGIPVWITIVAVCVTVAVLSVKYQDKIEKFFLGLFKKKKSKNKEE